MPVIGKLKDGELFINGEMEERLPSVKDGLIFHAPMDGVGGLVDVVGGYNPYETILSNVDLMSTTGGNPMDPKNWSRGRGGGGNLVWDDNEQALLHDSTSESYWEFNGYIKAVVGRTYYMSCSIKSAEDVTVDKRFYCGITQRDLNKAYIGGNDGHIYFVRSGYNPPANTWETFTGSYTATAGVEFMRPMMLTNYQGGIGANKMWMKDFRLWYVDQDNSNVIVHESGDGVTISKTTTNLATGVNIGFNHGRWTPVTSYPKGLPINDATVYKRISNNTYWGTFHDYIPANPSPYNRTFTVSCWYYLEDGYDGTVTSSFYGSPLAGDSVYTTISTSIRDTFSTAVKGKWVYGEQTLTVTTNASAYTYFAGWGGGTIAAGKDCYVAGFKLEERPFATPYNAGSRADSILRYVIPGMSARTTYSFAIDYKHSDLSKYGSNMVFLSSYDGVTGGSWFGLNANTNILNPIGIQSPVNVWNKFIVTYDGLTTKIWLNGVNVYSSASKMLFSTDNLSFSSMFGWVTTTHLSCHSIRNVSIYSKVLSDNEIKKLSKPNFSISKEGSITSRVNENTLSIPSGSLVLPLGSDGSDISGMYSPTSEYNSVYDNNALWIGTQTTNLWTGTRYSWEAAATGTVQRDSTFPGPFQGVEVVRVKANTIGVDYQTILWTVPVEGPDIKYYHSVYVWLEEGSYVGIGQHWNPWANAPTNKRYVPKKTWTRISVPVTTVDNTHPNVAIEYCTDGIAYITAPQYEKRNFMTPFVNGTRPAGGIRWPLTFSENASFSFWHKMAQDSESITGQFQAPNVFEIGNYYNNSSMTLWYYGGNNLRLYGRQDGATGWTIGGDTVNGGIVMDSNYRSKWHHYSLVFSGAAGVINTVKVYIDGVLTFTRSGLTITSWSGSFFGLDSFNGERPNAYYRDIIWARKAFTQSELEVMYKGQMKHSGDKLNVRGKINELGF